MISSHRLSRCSPAVLERNSRKPSIPATDPNNNFLEKNFSCSWSFRRILVIAEVGKSCCTWDRFYSADILNLAKMRTNDAYNRCWIIFVLFSRQKIHSKYVGKHPIFSIHLSCLEIEISGKSSLKVSLGVGEGELEVCSFTLFLKPCDVSHQLLRIEEKTSLILIVNYFKVSKRLDFIDSLIRNFFWPNIVNHVNKSQWQLIRDWTRVIAQQEDRTLY